MSKIIAQITWTDQDIVDAFVSKYKRVPSEEELVSCLNSFSAKQIEDRSIEFGRDFIIEAINKIH